MSSVGGLKIWHYPALMRILNRPSATVRQLSEDGLDMKFVFLLWVMAAGWASVASAEDRIYRCGNEYTNTVSEAQAKTCKLVSGGNVTVIQSARLVAPAGPKTSSSSPRVDAADQRAKDSDARMILESELRKAEAKQVELQQSYNNGEPEKLGAEMRNNQKYLDRVAEMKAALSRNESDIEGIRRELDRLGASASH